MEHWNPDLIHLHGVDFLDYLPPNGVPVVATLHLPPSWYRCPRFCAAAATNLAALRFRIAAEDVPKRSASAAFLSNGVSENLRRDHVKKRNFALALGRICPEKGLTTHKR